MTISLLKQPITAALFGLALAGCQIAQQASANNFEIALLGDLPYGFGADKFERLVDDINGSEAVAVLHAGDIKSGQTSCGDSALKEAHRLVTRFKAPLIYTPGDNEWTDCHRAVAGSFNPLTRLALIRELFFSEPPSLGGNQQSADFPENRVFNINGIAVGTVHVVGSFNGLLPWSDFDKTDSFGNPRADRIDEWRARDAAALAWLEAIFKQAKRDKARGLIIMIHANPMFDSVAKGKRAGKPFAPFITRLAALSADYGKPVLFAHGDFHVYIKDQPLGPNLTRVQTDGGLRLSWVSIKVDPNSPTVFTIEKKPVAMSGPR